MHDEKHELRDRILVMQLNPKIKEELLAKLAGINLGKSEAELVDFAEKLRLLDAWLHRAQFQSTIDDLSNLGNDILAEEKEAIFDLIKSLKESGDDSELDRLRGMLGRV